MTTGRINQIAIVKVSEESGGGPPGLCSHKAKESPVRVLRPEAAACILTVRSV